MISYKHKQLVFLVDFNYNLLTMNKIHNTNITKTTNYQIKSFDEPIIYWLDQPHEPDPEFSFEQFANESADPFIRESKFEGLNFNTALQRYRKMVASIEPSAAAWLEHGLLTLADKINKIKIAGQNDADKGFKQLEALAASITKDIQDLQAGHEFWIPGGWIDNTDKGHAMVYRIKKQQNGKYSLTIFNSGSGIEYHHQVIVPEGMTPGKTQVKYQTFLTKLDIEPDTLCDHKLIQALLEMQTVPFWDRNTTCQADNIYHGVLKHLGGTLEPRYDPLTHLDLYESAQRGGSCTMQCLYAVQFYKTVIERLPDPAALGEYKLFKYRYRKKSLIEACHYFLNGSFNFQEYCLINDVKSSLSNMALKLCRKNLLNDQELKECSASLEHIEQKLREKKEKSRSSYYPALLSYKLKSIFSLDGIKYHRQFILSLDSAIARDEKSDGLSQFTPPDIKLNPLEFANHLTEFTDKLLKDDLTIENCTYSIIFILQALPIPKREGIDPFWDKIPDKEIGKCLISLFKLTRLAITKKTIHPVNNPKSIIALHTALAIADKLARRLPETRLEGYTVNYYDLIEFAQSLQEPLHDPHDHTRLEEILQYFNSEFDLTKIISKRDLAEASFDSIFGYYDYNNSDNDFDDDKDDILINKKYAYYKQFLNDPKIKQNIGRDSLQNQIVRLVEDTLESNTLLPESVHHLKQITHCCWFSFMGKDFILSNSLFSNRLKNYESTHYSLNFEYKRDISETIIKEYNQQKKLDSDYLRSDIQNDIIFFHKLEKQREMNLLGSEWQDEIIRILAYYENKPDSIFEETQHQQVLRAHLFRPRALLSQLRDEPRTALKLLNFINLKLAYFQKSGKHHECLYFAKLGIECSRFINYAQKLEPDKYSPLSSELNSARRDYRSFLLNEILPISMPQLHLQILEELAFNPEPADIIQAAQDFFAFKLSLSVLRNRIGEKELERILHRSSKTLERQISLSLKYNDLFKPLNNPNHRNQILNEALSAALNKKIALKWEGIFLQYQAGNFSINLVKYTITENEKVYSCLPTNLLNQFKDLLKGIKSVRQHKEFYEIESENGISHVGYSYPDYILLREFEGREYRYAPSKKEITDLLNSIPIDFERPIVWFCQEAENPHYRVETENNKVYYINLNKKSDNDFTVKSVCDGANKTNILVHPRDTKLQPLETFIGKREGNPIICWRKEGNKHNLHDIEIPFLNLHFRIDEEGKASCREVPGYHLALDQEACLSDKWTNYLLLVNDTGEKKALLRYGKSYEVYDISDIIGHPQLKASSVRGGLYAMIQLLQTNHYETAAAYLKQIKVLGQYEEGDLSLICALLKDFNDGHPAALAVLLHLFAMVEETYQRNLEALPVNIIGKIKSDYVAYLENNGHAGTLRLNHEEEKIILRFLQRRSECLPELIIQRIKDLFGNTDTPVIITPNTPATDAPSEPREFVSLIKMPLKQPKKTINLTQTEFKDCFSQFYTWAKSGKPSEKKQLRLILDLLEGSQDFKNNLRVKNGDMIALANLLRTMLNSTFTFLYPKVEKFQASGKEEDLMKQMIRALKYNAWISSLLTHKKLKIPSILNHSTLKPPAIKELLEDIPTPKSRKDEPIAHLSNKLHRIDKKIQDNYQTLAEESKLSDQLAKEFNRLKKDLTERRKKIKELVNRLPEKTSSQMTLERLTKRKLSFDKAVKLFEKGTPSEYRAQTFLSSQQIMIFEEEMGEYLIMATRFYQLKRALNILNGPKNSDVINRAKQELKAERHYLHTSCSPRIARTFLIFEYRHKILLRKIQIEKSFDILPEPFKVRCMAELGTGTGKSKVIAPLNQKLRNKVINIWPQPIYDDNKNDMKNLVHQAFDQEADTFEFDRDTRTEEANITLINRVLQKGLNEQKQINTIPECVQSSELKYLEVLYQAWENILEISDITISNFQNILKTFLTSEAHIDEGHVNFSPRREVNFTLGEPVPEPIDHIKLIEKIYRFLIQDEEAIKRYNIADNKQYFIPPELFITTIAPKMAREFISFCSIDKEHEVEFCDYVLGKINMPSWVPNHPKNQLIGLLRGELKQLLPDCLNQKPNVHFGLSKLHPDREYAIPYDGNDSPIETAQYENIHIALNKTYQIYLYNGLAVKQLWTIVKALQKSAIQESKTRKVPLEKTKAYQFYEKHFPKDFDSLFAVSEEVIQYHHLALKKNPELIFHYIKHFVTPQLVKYKAKLRSDAQNFNSQLGGFIAMSATPGIEQAYGQKVKFHRNLGNNKAMIDTIEKKCSDPRTIHQFDTESAKELLSKMTQKLFKKGESYRMLIDIGSLLEGISNIEVSKFLLNHFKATDPNIKGIAFYHNDKKMVLTDVNKEPIPFEQCQLPPFELFTYCDNKHTFGADFKLFPQAKGVATFDAYTNMNEVIQGCGRLRDLFNDQMLEWVVLKGCIQAILGEGVPTIRTLLDKAEKNQAQKDKEDNYWTLIQQMDNCLRSVIMKKLIYAKPKDAIAIFGLFIDLLVPQVEINTLKLYGIDYKLIKGADDLLLYRKNLLKKVKTLDGLTADEREQILHSIRSYKQIIIDLDKEGRLPESVISHQVNLNTMAHVKNHVKTKVETNVQTFTQSRARSKYRRPIPWDHKTDLFDIEKFKPTHLHTDSKIAYYAALFFSRARIVLTSIFSKRGMIKLLPYAGAALITYVARRILIQIAHNGFLYSYLLKVLSYAPFYIIGLSILHTSLFFREHAENVIRKCRVYPVSAILRTHRDPDIAGIHSFYEKDEETELLMTDNFVQVFSDFPPETPLSHEQKNAHEVLVIRDLLPNGKYKWTMVMGDQSTDARFWRQKLRADHKISDEAARIRTRKICLYDLQTGIAIDSKSPFDEQELNRDPAFQKLLVKAKLYNGDVVYTYSQKEILNQFAKNAPIAAFFKKAILHHDEKVTSYDQTIDLLS